MSRVPLSDLVLRAGILPAGHECTSADEAEQPRSGRQVRAAVDGTARPVAEADRAVGEAGVDGADQPV